MEPVVSKIAKEYRDKFSVAKMDIDKNRKTHHQYGVDAIPAYLVFKEGRLALRFRGVTPEADFVKKVLGAIR